MKFIKNEKSISYVVLIFAIILRCINFGTVPAGYHFDELGSAIDAWFIINYGTDRYGISYPVYFINYGGGQSALYTYLCAVSIFILEFNEIAIKLPALLSSVLFAVFGMKLIGITFSNYINSSRLQLLFVILYAVSPYCFMSSRFGLDCNFMLGGSDFTIDFWAYIKSSSTEIAWALYPPSGDSRRLKLMYYSGKVQCWYNSGNSVLYSTSSSSNKVAHYAFVWQQNLRKLSGYIDGTLVGSITTNVFSTVADSSIAFNQYSQNGACDYFDEFRISNCARWTENFTPPTAPYVLQTENRLVTKSIEVAE